MSKLFVVFAIVSFALVVCLDHKANAQTPSIKLVGQVVCSSCWAEAADRKKNPYGTAADVTCALDCSEKGLPQALAAQGEKGFTLYTMERGLYKGKAKDFLEFLPDVVEVEGTVRTEKNKNFIKVNSIKKIRDAAILPPLQDDNARLALKDVFGADANLDQYKGRIVVLNFWATFCEPCRKEMPDLAAIQNDYAAMGVQVIGASADEASDVAKVLKFTKEVKVNFPVWLGAATTDMERFGLGTVLPGTAIVDRAGKIVWRQVGIIKPVELRKELDRILGPSIALAKKAAKQADKTNASIVPA